MSNIPAGYKQTEVGVIPEDWEVKKLSELTTLMTNGFVGTATSHYTEFDEGVLYIQGFNVEENTFNFTGVKRVTQEFHKKHSKSCLQEGDLLTIQTGEVGLTTIVPKELAGANCHALIITRFRKEKTDPYFFAYYLNAHQGRTRLREIETGTTMKHINVGDMVHFDVPLPPTKAEQTAIATALSDTDALIASLEKLITKKRNIKQGAMQELLKPKEGWVVKKLGEVAPLQRGFDLPATQLQTGKYPVVYSNGIENLHSEYKVKAPGVVTGRSGTLGKVTYVNEDYWPHNTSLWVTDFKDNYPLFIYYLYVHLKLERFGTGSGVPTLNRNDVHDFKVAIPNYQEQTRIAAILSDMDAEIEALEKKLGKSRRIKQGMMQELLTGKTRLI